MTGPAYRVVARFFFEGPPRLDMAHRLPMAHRAPAPEPLWKGVAVFGAGIVGIAFVVSIVLAAVPA